MRRVLHLSDLHLGATDTELVEPLIELCRSLNPDLIAVSGDLTQRARKKQFREAGALLKRLPHPQLVVPGNHDLPLYNFFSRWLAPWRGYRQWIHPEIEPVFEDEELLVVGVNTARKRTPKYGWLTRAQRERLKQISQERESSRTHILVAHHPLIHTKDSLAGFDLILTGHLHLTDMTPAKWLRPAGLAPVLQIQAGTALSHRRRGETNAFHCLEIDSREVTVRTYCWSTKGRRWETGSERRHYTRLGSTAA